MDAKLIQVPPQTVDDFAELQKLRDAFAPTESRYQKAYKELKAQLADKDPASEYLATGERFKIRISACATERFVDIPKARKKLGAAAFLKVCSVTLSALGNLLAKPEVDALTVSSQTGSRTYSSIALEGAEEKQ